MGADYPDSLGPAHFNPPMIRVAFQNVADILGMIREQWIDSDEKIREWIADGMGPATGGFEKVGRKERAGIDDLLYKLRSDLIPLILPHADPNLRDRIQNAMRLLQLDEWAVDAYGDKSQRWRQMWPASGLQPEFDELAPMLRARGDAVVLHSDAMSSVDLEEAKRVHVESVGKDIVRIKAFAAGKGPVTTEIRGRSLAPMFRIIREASRTREDLVTWEDLERAWALKTGYESLRTIGTLKDYARRIRGRLEEAGLRHLWEMNSSVGVRWLGD